MAQRKPKESLIAEIPKPRLTDEELMEIFYGGERKKTNKLENEERVRNPFEESSVSLSEVAKEKEASSNIISLKEPSLQEPFFKEPSIREPIKKEIIHNVAFSTDTPSLVEVVAHPSETNADFSQPKLFSLSRAQKDHYSHPLRDVNNSTSDSRTVDTDLDRSAKSSTKLHKGVSWKGSLEKGSLKEGYFEEGLLTPIFSGPSGEVLKRAFDVLPMLSPLEQLMYLWFLNMSYEVGRDSCRATMTLLQRATGISEKLVRENIRSLLRKGCLNLLDGGAAGKAALYHVALPEEAADAIIRSKGSYKEGSTQEPSYAKPSDKFTSLGNLPERNLPSHIERESFSSTLSIEKKPLSGEPFSREGSLPSSLPVKIADNVIDRFYSMTGQTRISRQKRERSRLQLIDLLKQGFQVDDVLYTIEWARGNISGPIHSFGLIPEIIGQAISKRPATSQRQGFRSERSSHQRSLESDAEVEQEQKEHEHLEALYATLPLEEQDALRAEALHLVESEYGSHVPGQQTLVRIKLMELLRERFAEQGSQSKKEEG